MSESNQSQKVHACGSKIIYASTLAAELSAQNHHQYGICCFHNIDFLDWWNTPL